MALDMITVFVNVMTKGSIMEVMNQKTGKNDYSIVFYAISCGKNYEHGMPLFANDNFFLNCLDVLY